MSKLIADIEHGTAILVHDITDGLVHPDQLPAEALSATESFAKQLGLQEDHIGPVTVGWCFQVLDKAIAALAESTNTPPAAAEPAQAASAADQPAQAPAAPPAPAAAQAPAGEQAAVAPAGASTEATATTQDAQSGEQPPKADEHSGKIDEIIRKAQAEFGGPEGS